MKVMYHGTTVLFPRFDLGHVLEGDGKMKFGYGIYLTSSFKSAAHYSGVGDSASLHYVYTVHIPEISEGRFISFKQAVHKSILERAEERLGETIPERMTKDGKDFRKYIAKTLGGSSAIESEKSAAEFLDSIGVFGIIWPYSWRNAGLGVNCAIFNPDRLRITEIHQVELDKNKQLIDGSQRLVRP